jgi:hypothetical protein
MHLVTLSRHFAKVSLRLSPSVHSLAKTRTKIAELAAGTA